MKTRKLKLTEDKIEKIINDINEKIDPAVPKEVLWRVISHLALLKDHWRSQALGFSAALELTHSISRFYEPIEPDLPNP